MSAHTPGPWRLTKRRITENDPWTEMAIAGPDHPGGDEIGNFICVISPIDSYNERDEANARLIAAAPELLDALRKIHHSATVIAMLESCGEKSTLEGIANLAFAAIAKAERA